MTRAEFDAMLDHADAVIAQQMARLEVQGGPGVTVQGDSIALDDLTTPTVAARTWQVGIWVGVSMQQIYTSSEPGQVSDTFVYEPRFLAYLDGRTTAEQAMSDRVLPDLITDGEMDPDEIYPGRPFQEDLPSVPPDQEESNLTKNATCTFYVRGHFNTDTATLASGFDVGSVDLDLVYYQTIIDGDPPEIIDMERAVTVRATYAGVSATITPFTTAYNAPGDSAAHLELLTATKI